MNEITLPYHLFIPSIISILILGIIFFKRKRIFGIGKWKWFWISLTVFFLFYLFIVGGATYSDIYAQWNLNKFDLNKDGFFSGNEITAEQSEAMRNLTSDTGRNFSFITGLIFSGIIAFFVFGIGKITEQIKKKKTTHNNGYN
jgi:phosphoglycerol transferase MdoB-like AlkP superfamily enzyme